MTSLSTVSAGAKPATSLLAGRSANVDGTANAYAWTTFNSCIQRLYTGAEIGTEVTVLNITGSGVIDIMVFFALSASTSSNTKLIIDGTTVLDDSRASSIQYNGHAMVGGGSYYPSVDPGSGYGQGVIFNTSMVAKVTCDVESMFGYNYYLT